MLRRSGMFLLIVALMGIHPAWTAGPAQNTPPPPFCVHESSVQSYLDSNGRAASEIHTETWVKAPNKVYSENENFIHVSNDRESWFYHKIKHTLRVDTVINYPASQYTADYRISNARKIFNNVEVKEANGEVTITYKTREAKPCSITERITLVEKSRFMKSLNIEIVSPDGTYVCRRFSATYDYTQITDESIFNRPRPTDAQPEKTQGK